MKDVFYLNKEAIEWCKSSVERKSSIFATKGRLTMKKAIFTLPLLITLSSYAQNTIQIRGDVLLSASKTISTVKDDLLAEKKALKANSVYYTYFMNGSEAKIVHSFNAKKYPDKKADCVVRISTEVESGSIYQLDDISIPLTSRDLYFDKVQNEYIVYATWSTKGKKVPLTSKGVAVGNAEASINCSNHDAKSAAELDNLYPLAQKAIQAFNNSQIPKCLVSQHKIPLVSGFLSTFESPKATLIQYKDCP